MTEFNQSPLFKNTFGDVDDKVSAAKESLKNPPNPEVARAKNGLVSFYKENKAGVDTILFIGAVLVLNKRMVTKAVSKQVDYILKELEGGVRINLPQYLSDLDVWDETQRLAFEARWAAQEIAEQGLNP